MTAGRALIADMFRTVHQKKLHYSSTLSLAFFSLDLRFLSLSSRAHYNTDLTTERLFQFVSHGRGAFCFLSLVVLLLPLLLYFSHRLAEEDRDGWVKC